MPYIAEIDTSTLVTLLISLLLGGGAAVAFQQALKGRPEAEAIGTKSLISVNQELRTEIDRLGEVIGRQRDQIDRQETRLREQSNEVDQLQNRLSAFRHELEDMETRLDERGQ